MELVIACNHEIANIRKFGALVIFVTFESKSEQLNRLFKLLNSKLSQGEITNCQNINVIQQQNLNLIS